MTDILSQRTHERMQDVLMDPAAVGPAAHYYMIGGEGKRPNITVWESGTVGGEYIKTYGHYHSGTLEDTYTVLSGEGIVLLQKQGKSEDVIEEFKAYRVRKGDVVIMPPGYAHVIVNIGSTCLVTEDISRGEGRADYEPLKRMHGMGYYVVEHDGRPVLERNQRYSSVQASAAIIEVLH